MDKMKTTLFALKYDGKKPIIKWTKKLNGVSSSGGLIDKNGIFYFATDDLYALYPNGKIKWTSTISPSGFSALALGKDGTLYAVSDKLYAIKDQQSDLFLTIKADKTNLNVGDVVKLQITVNDFAKDRAFDTLLTYKVPDQFNYWDATSKNGKLNFDPMKKIITWDLGTAYSRTNNVLYLQLFMKKAGTYTVKPNLSTSTYDPNLSQRIGSIELKVASKTTKYCQIGRHK
jgi:hypothetical protein